LFKLSISGLGIFGSPEKATYVYAEIEENEILTQLIHIVISGLVESKIIHNLA